MVVFACCCWWTRRVFCYWTISRALSFFLRSEKSCWLLLIYCWRTKILCFLSSQSLCLFKSLLPDFQRTSLLNPLSKAHIRFLLTRWTISISNFLQHSGLLKNISKISQPLMTQYLIHMVDSTSKVHFTFKRLNLWATTPRILHQWLTNIIFILLSMFSTKFSFNNKLKGIRNSLFTSSNFS